MDGREVVCRSQNPCPYMTAPFLRGERNYSEILSAIINTKKKKQLHPPVQLPQPRPFVYSLAEDK